MKSKELESRRKYYIVRIGPELMNVIKEQMKSINEVTYGVVKDSTWEAGEIIAKKIKGVI